MREVSKYYLSKLIRLLSWQFGCRIKDDLIGIINIPQIAVDAALLEHFLPFLSTVFTGKI
jgi:hypothetical protein